MDSQVKWTLVLRNQVLVLQENVMEMENIESFTTQKSVHDDCSFEEDLNCMMIMMKIIVLCTVGQISNMNA